MSIVIPPLPPGVPSGATQTLNKGSFTVVGPDSTTIEIDAAAVGKQGTLVNIRALAAVNSVPSFVGTEPFASYTIGEETIKFVVLPHQFLAVGGLPVRPYTINLLVEAQNAVLSSDKILMRFAILVAESVDHVNGLELSLQVQNSRVTVTPTTGPTITMVGLKKVSTCTYVTDVVVQDPEFLQVLVRILGPTNSKGTARLHREIAFEPDPAPILPVYGPPFLGDLKVGDDLAGFPDPSSRRGFELREDMVNRKFYLAVRAEDFDNTNIIHELFLELNMKSTPTILKMDVLVRQNNTVLLLEDVPTIVGPEGLISVIDTFDSDTVEILVQPQGLANTQFLLREEHLADEEPFDTFPAIPDIVSYDSNGIAQYTDQSFVVGGYDIDNKVAIIEATNARTFQSLSPSKALKFQVEATSKVNANNTIHREFRVLARAQTVVTALVWYYSNSRTVDANGYPQMFPLPPTALGGRDANHPFPGPALTGTGTFADPFLLAVDKPEQLQIFVVPTVILASGLVFVQTGYQYNPASLIPEPYPDLYPDTPEAWGRAFPGGSTGLMAVPPNVPLVFPHPVPPPNPPEVLPKNKPLTGEQIVVASGGTPGMGAGQGYSKKIQFYARAQGVGSADNVIESTIVIVVRDPLVAFP